jgi:1,4-dihydroxy-2-naphthoate polyprenyltransferase
VEQPESLSKLQIWLLAARLKTLPAAISPVFVGVALAIQIDSFRPWVSIFAILGSLSLQILSNLANDYFDYLKGVDTEERVGPVRVMHSGLLTVKEMQLGILVNIVITLIIGFYILFSALEFTFAGLNGAVIIIIIGISSIIFSILYSGGPFPLSSLGLGDVFVFLFFGIIAVQGTFFINVGTFELAALIAACAPGAIITAILVVNNYRDYETDKNVGKKTLVVIFGESFGKWQYRFLIGFSYAIPLLMFLMYPLHFNMLVMLPILSSPLAFAQLKKINKNATTEELNKLLANTAKLSFIFSLLFSIGLVL